MQDYIKRIDCRCCGSKDLVEILDLADQPLANSYHTKEAVLKNYPLKLNLCTNCYHLQLSIVVNPDLLFKNYLYVSGTTQTLKEYFNEFVYICGRYTSGKNVLDIACNDGTQLNSFKKKGYTTFGIDPAENLYELSKLKHDIICDFWSLEVAKKVGNKKDVIVAQNVFAHVNNLDEFLNACKEVMYSNSVLFIQTSQANMILNNEFDTIYHEHLSFFNILSIKGILNKNGFSLIDVFKTSIHGGSYVFVIKKGEHDESISEHQIALERKNGLYDIDTYFNYSKRCYKIIEDLNRLVDKIEGQGKKIIGYGAAAKGNTLLNFSKIKLKYIVDDNPLKWNLYTPGRNILICEPEVLTSEDSSKIVVIPLAWNFFDEIRNRIFIDLGIGRNVEFIKYFPQVEII